MNDMINAEWMQMSLTASFALMVIGAIYVAVAFWISKKGQMGGRTFFWSTVFIVVSGVFLVASVVSGTRFPLGQMIEKKEKYDKEVIQPYLLKNYSKRLTVDEFEIAGDGVETKEGMVYPVLIKYTGDDGYQQIRKVLTTIEKVKGLERTEATYVEIEEKIGPYHPGRMFYRIKTPN